MGRQPLYFGPAGARRYGVYRPAVGRQRRLGAVVIPPFPTERNDTLRSLRRLAERLASDGLPTLRYDPLGTGDSDGDGMHVRWSDWEDGVALAIDTLRARAGVSRVALLGVRLGATLAWSQRHRRDVDALALWAPIDDGAAYVSALRHEHEAWLASETRERPGAVRYQGSHEVLGAPLPPALRRDLEALSIAGPLPRRADVLVADALQPSWFTPARGARWQRLVEPPVWSADAGMDAAPVAGEAIDAIAAWAGGLR